MASKQQGTKTSGDNPLKGLQKTFLMGDPNQMRRAARSDPAVAALLKKTQKIGSKKGPMSATDIVNELETIKEWDSLLGQEASKRAGPLGGGSSWLDGFSMLKIGTDVMPSSGSGIRFETSQKKDDWKANLETKKRNGKPMGKEGMTNEAKDTSPNVENFPFGSFNYKFKNQEWMKSETFTKDGRKRTSAEILMDAIEADMFPTDPTVRENFGFSKVNNREEETCMLGLYEGLMLYLPVPPNVKTLQEWMDCNNLAAGIYKSYNSQQWDTGYFHWFKTNKRFFDRNYVNPKGPRGVIKNGPPLDQELFGKMTGAS